jgi:CheY-like chemotaxis protein
VRILVVEDDPDARDLLRTTLELVGARVTVAGTVQEALAALEARLPDVVVSDIGMPGEDGYALVRKLRARPPEAGGALPAVALSAHAARDDAERSRAAGFELHIAKPIDPESLVDALAGLVGRRSSEA